MEAIDLRSDTVTLPTQTMREAIYHAELGDDVFGEDPTTNRLEKIAAEVINSNVQPVADYRAGKETALKFLVGQVMRATKGRANPQLVNEVLKKKLAGD